MQFEIDPMPELEPIAFPACETCGKVGCSGLWGSEHCPSNRTEPEQMPYSDDREMRHTLLDEALRLVAAEESGDFEELDACDYAISVLTSALEA